MYTLADTVFIHGRITTLNRSQPEVGIGAVLLPERRRDGACQWEVFEDIAKPGRVIEHFLVPSWQEHARQHRRVSRADADLQGRMQGFHRGAQGTRAAHLIAARSQNAHASTGEAQ